MLLKNIKIASEQDFSLTVSTDMVIFLCSGDSIWPIALKDTWKYLHRKFDKKDYVTFEKDLLRLQNLWHGCTEMDTDREDCPKEVFERLHSYMKDFQWINNFPEFSRRNYVAIRVAYQAMELLMLKVLAENPLVEKRKEIVDWYDTIKNHYLKSAKYFVDFEEKMEDERPFDVSVVEICQVSQIFWKEFEQPACEKRWKKNIDNFNEKRKEKRNAVVQTQQNDNNNSNNSSNDDEDDSLFGDDEEDEEESGDENPDDAKFYKTFRADFSKVDNIGGITSDFRTIMDGKFTDYGGKKVIPIGRRVADVYKSPKGENMERLVTIGFRKRDEYVKTVVKDFNTYVKQTYGKVKRAGEIFMRQIHQLIVQY